MAAFNIELNQRLGQAQTCAELSAVVTENVGKFNVVNAATAFHKFGKTFRTTSQKIDEIQPSLELLQTRLVKLLPVSCQPRHLSNILWASGVLDIKLPELEKAVAKEMPVQAPRMNQQELANAIYGLGKRSSLGEQGFEIAALLVATALPGLDDFTPQGLSNCVWAFGNISPQISEREIAIVVNSVARMCSRFNGLELTNALWGLAKIQATLTPSSTETFFQAIRGSIAGLEPRTLSTLAWATAKLAIHSKTASFGAVFGAPVAAKVGKMNGHEISNTCWAFATACEHERDDLEHVLTAIAKGVEQQLMTLSARQVATIVWSFATLHFKNEALLKMLAKRARKVAEEMNAQDLDNLSWGCARLEFSSRRLMQAVATTAEKLLLENPASFSAKNMANLIWATAKLGCEGMEYYLAVIARAAKNRLHEFNARDLANAAWGLVTLSVPVPRFLRCVAKEAALRVDSFNAQECSKLLWALERGAVPCAELQEAAGARRQLKYEFPGFEVSLNGILAGGRQNSATRERSGTTAATGSALWDPSFVLADWLARGELEAWDPSNFKTVKGKRSIELGAGLGLCSITAAYRGFNALATDGDQQVLSLLEQNIASNKPTEGKLNFCKLEWGDQPPSTGFDLVLGSGIVYGAETAVWTSLVSTLVGCCGPNTVVLLAHGQGAPPGLCQGSGPFVEMLDQHFSLTAIPQHTLHSDYRKSCVIHCLQIKHSKKRKDAETITTPTTQRNEKKNQKKK